MDPEMQGATVFEIVLKGFYGGHFFSIKQEHMCLFTCLIVGHMHKTT